MPRLNARGWAAMGVGDGQPSVDGVPLGSVVGGCTQWLGDTPIAQVVLNSAYCVATWNGTQWIKLHDGGANFIAASGTFWATQGQGLRANFPFASGSVMSLCGTDNRGAAKHGAVALCTTPDCTAVDVRWSDGTVERINAVAYALEIISKGQFIWNGGQQGYDCRTAMPMTGRRVARLPDGDWIVGWNDEHGLVAQLNGALDGYVLEPRPIAFNHDAMAVDGQLVVAWSVTSGEAPNDLVKITVDRTRPRVVFKVPDKVPGPIVNTHAKGAAMEIDGKVGQLRYVGGKLASPDAPGTGVWAIIDGKPTQWRGVVWGGPDVRYRAKLLPDGTYKLTNEAHDCLAGADGGPHSPALDKQMYHKPTGQTADSDAGSLERWHGYTNNDNGAIELQVEQLSVEGKPIFVCPLSFEVIG